MQKTYAIFYKVNGKTYSLFTHLGCIGVSELVKVDLFKNKELLIKRYKRLVQISKGIESKNDVILNPLYRFGKVFISRIGSKDCPVVLTAAPHWQCEKDWPNGKDQDYALRVACRPN